MVYKIPQTLEHPEWGEIDVIVKVEVSGQYLPAKLFGDPNSCYPAEYPEVEILSIIVDGGEHDGADVEAVFTRDKAWVSEMEDYTLDWLKDC